MCKTYHRTKMMPSNSDIKFVFFGSSTFSHFVLEELEKAGLEPVLNITNAREDIPMEKLRDLGADLFVVASFGKILKKELIDMPRHKTLNVHPSLLPEWRGPSPIQASILGGSKTGVSIMRMDEEVDHGPLLATREVELSPWPDHYRVVEEKLAREGGKLLAEVLPKWVAGEVEEKEQDHSQATFTKMVRKEDAQVDMQGDAVENLRKVLAYSTSPVAYTYFERKDGKKIRLKILDAEIVDGKFAPTRVIPEGKKAMSWPDFLRGNS